MSPSLRYRIASVLLALFGLAHQLGFRSVDPAWGVDSALGALKAARFQVQGMTRTYGDFFSGFFVTVLLFFAAGDGCVERRAPQLGGRGTFSGG